MLKQKAVRLLRHQHGELSDAARLRQPDRHRHHHVGLRARHRARCVFSLNYRIALAEEGCFDRSQASHAINLCDMNAKYADVVKTSEVLTFLDALPSGMFDLPKGKPVRRREPQRRAANF